MTDFEQALKDHSKADELAFSIINASLLRIQASLNAQDELMRDLATKKEIEPVLELYMGLVGGQKIVTGLGGVVIAISAIGGGILWVLNYFKPHV